MHGTVQTEAALMLIEPFLRSCCIYQITILSNVIFQTTFTCICIRAARIIFTPTILQSSSWWTLFCDILTLILASVYTLIRPFFFFSAKKWFQGVRPRQMGRLGLGMRLWGWWLVTGDWWIWESKCLEFRQVNARTTCKGWSNVVHLAANDPMSLGSLKFAAMLSGIGKLSTLAGRNWSRRTYEP